MTYFRTAQMMMDLARAARDPEHGTDLLHLLDSEHGGDLLRPNLTATAADKTAELRDDHDVREQARQHARAWSGASLAQQVDHAAESAGTITEHRVLLTVAAAVASRIH